MSALTNLLVDALRPTAGRDWHVRAGSLDWDVERTVEHVVASLGKYTLYLASRASRYIPLQLDRMAVDVTHDDWLAGLAACAEAFQVVAEAAPEGTRAFHTAGMADVEGYVGLACAHVLEHGHDIARGLGVGFDPPAEVCAAVTARLFPWTPTAEEPWTMFLYVVGRIDLPGHPPVNPATPPVLSPLAEWEGAIPVAPDFPVAAYVIEPGTRRWRPVP